MFLCTHCGDWQCRKWQYLSKVPTFWRCCGVEKNIFLVLSGPWIQLNNKLITEWKFKNRTLSSESKQMSLINAVNTSKVLVGAISLVLIVISTHRLPNGHVCLFSVWLTISPSLCMAFVLGRVFIQPVDYSATPSHGMCNIQALLYVNSLTQWMDWLYKYLLDTHYMKHIRWINLLDDLLGCLSKLTRGICKNVKLILCVETEIWSILVKSLTFDVNGIMI
jgi:hypothetical protein